MASPKNTKTGKKPAAKSKKSVVKKAPSVVKKASSKPVKKISKKTVHAPEEVSEPFVPQWVEEPVSHEHKTAVKKQPETSSVKSFLIILLIVVTLGVAFFVFKPQINKYLSKKETDTVKSVEIQPEPAQPAEQKQTEQKVVEQKPVEQKPVEQKPVEQKPVEQKPAAVEQVIDPNAFYHEVQPKEQLTEISKKYYGTVARWQQIYYANKDQLSDPKKIYPGQKLIIPGKKK